MFSELNTEQIVAREQNASTGIRSPAELDQIVVMVRLELYNRSLPCGPTAVRRRLALHYALKPLPSKRTIARMLARNGLTHGRTGWYEGDDPDRLPT
jgi:hypothetical protein